MLTSANVDYESIVLREFADLQRVVPTIFAMLTVTGCSYRFTNQHIGRPAGLKTIAVEAVYDTSRQVLPHEILWEELQKAFAKNGKLTLVARSNADALVRAHILTASVSPGRIQSIDDDQRDPEISSPQAAAATDIYKNFRTLTRAGEYTLEDRMRYTTRIEVIDLRSRKILLNKTYGSSRILRTSRGGGDASGFYLIYNEAQHNRFREISRSIAHKLVEDLLVTY